MNIEMDYQQVLGEAYQPLMNNDDATHPGERPENLIPSAIPSKYHENFESLYSALQLSKCINVESLNRMVAEFGASVIEQCSDCSKQLIFPNDEDPHAGMRYQRCGTTIAVCRSCVAKKRYDHCELLAEHLGPLDRFYQQYIRSIVVCTTCGKGRYCDECLGFSVYPKSDERSRLLCRHCDARFDRLQE